MANVTDSLTELLEPQVDNLGFELVDLEFVKEGSDWVLRLYIDHENGIFIDDCVAVSQAVSQILDEQDPIEREYLLEVSSPGIERVLKKDKDFQRFKGSKVLVRLFSKFEERKKITGLLGDFDQETLTVITEEKEMKIPRELISRINTVWEE